MNHIVKPVVAMVEMVGVELVEMEEVEIVAAEISEVEPLVVVVDKLVLDMMGHMTVADK